MWVESIHGLGRIILATVVSWVGFNDAVMGLDQRLCMARHASIFTKSQMEDFAFYTKNIKLISEI